MQRENELSTGRRTEDSKVTDSEHSAIGQSIRLITERFWVRVPVFRQGFSRSLSSAEQYSSTSDVGSNPTVRSRVKNKLFYAEGLIQQFGLMTEMRGIVSLLVIDDTKKLWREYKYAVAILVLHEKE